jgi:uncharacterized protein YcnI
MQAEGDFLMNCIRSVFAASLGAVATLLATVGIASAHVTVWPQTSTVSAEEMYTMRVPTERNDPTVKIVLQIPANVSFDSYEPVPGWTVTEDKDASGNVTRVTWTATAGGIAPGQFQEFSFIAENPKNPGSIAWNAFQYYKDGTIVAWTGAPGSDTPHSITQILAAAPATGTEQGTAPAGSATGQSAPSTPSTQPATSAPARSGGTGLVMGLSIVAIVLSAVSLIVSLRRRRG